MLTSDVLFDSLRDDLSFLRVLTGGGGGAGRKVMGSEQLWRCLAVDTWTDQVDLHHPVIISPVRVQSPSVMSVANHRLSSDFTVKNI